MDPFVAGVAETVRRYRLLAVDSGVVVALSGGPDSTALLAALAELGGAQRRLVAAHLDHGLRPERPAREDAEHARRLAARLGADFQEHRADVPALAERWRTSLEAAARRERYRFLRRVAAQQGCDRIALGHHRDDQVETVLIRLLSGAGSDGLAGMEPRRGGIVRPLYERTRREILAYLERRGLSYREDESNRDSRFLRNRVRAELLPFLRDRFYARVDDAVWRASRLLADEVAYLEERAAALLTRCRRDLPGGVWLDAAPLARAPSALRRRALRQACWEAAGAEGAEGAASPVTAEHVAALEAVAAGRRGGAHLPGGLRADYQQGAVRVACGKDAGCSLPVTLPIPGWATWLHPWSPLQARVRNVDDVEERDLSRPGHGLLDYGALGRPACLTVRAWRAGDRMRPLGAPGTRKLQDLFVDRKVPRALRSRLPLAIAAGEVVWVAGVALAHPYRITERTREVLHLWVDTSPNGM